MQKWTLLFLLVIFSLPAWGQQPEAKPPATPPNKAEAGKGTSAGPPVTERSLIKEELPPALKEELKPLEHPAKGKIGLGFTLPVLSLAEDPDFKPTGHPFGLFVDYHTEIPFISARFGYVNSWTEASYSAYGKDWQHQMNSVHWYGSYLAPYKPYDWIDWNFIEPVIGYLSAGVTWSSSRLTTNHGGATLKSSGMGSQLGAGMSYQFKDLGVGLQWIYISHQADFEGLNLYDGINHYSLMITYFFD